MPCILVHRSLLSGLAYIRVAGSTRGAVRLLRILHARLQARTPPGPQPIHEVPHVVFVAPPRRWLVQDFVGLHVLFGGDFAPSEPLSENLLRRACPLAPSRGQEPRYAPRRHSQKTCQNQDGDAPFDQLVNHIEKSPPRRIIGKFIIFRTFLLSARAYPAPEVCSPHLKPGFSQDQDSIKIPDERPVG